MLLINYPKIKKRARKLNIIIKLLIKMKKNKSKLITKKKLTSPDLITGLRQALFVLRLEQRAGKLLKTHQIKKIRREIARNLTKQNQQKSMTKNESIGGEI